MAFTGGMDLNQVGSKSRLRVIRDRYTNPQAANLTKFVASVDPNGVTAGAALTLQAAVSGLQLRRARRVTVSITDNSYSGATPLSVIVRLVGNRFGLRQTEDIGVTSTSGAEISATGTLYFDEITSAVMLSKTNAAASDALKVGADGTSFGLEFRIKATADVLSIINVSSGTEATPTAISSTTVDAAASAIKGITLAATDDWHVRYVAREDQGFGSEGVFP